MGEIRLWRVKFASSMQVKENSLRKLNKYKNPYRFYLFDGVAAMKKTMK